MTWRSNAKLLVVAVLLTVYFRVYETDAPSSQKKGRVFFNVESSEVVELELSMPASAADAEQGVDVRPIVLKYESFGDESPKWWIVKPFRFPALHPRVQALIHELVDMVRIAEIEEEGDFFSEAPEVHVRFKTQDGSEFTLDLGRDHRDTSLNFCCARTGDELFWTQKKARATFAVSLQELRGRALCNIPTDDVASISVEGAAPFAKVIKRERHSPWRLTSPVESLADLERAEKLLDDLNSWEIVGFESDTAVSAADLRAFGLAEPAIVVTVQSWEDRRSVTLEIGSSFKKDEQSLVYVRRRGSPHVFSALPQPVDDLKREAESYRNRFVLDLGMTEVQLIEGEVFRGDGAGQKFSAKRVEVQREQRRAGEISTADASVWEIEDHPSGESFRGDTRIIDRLIQNLRRLPIEKFVDAAEESGLESPRAKLVLGLDAGEPIELFIGDRSRDPLDKDSPVYYLKRGDVKGAYLVLTLLPSLLEQGGQALRERSVSDIEPGQVIELILSHAGRTWNLGRAPGSLGWALSDGEVADGVSLDSKLVDELVMLCSARDFTVKNYYPDLEQTGVDGTSKALASWVVSIRTASDQARFRKLYIGDPVDGTQPLEYFARLDDMNLPTFSIGEELPNLLTQVYNHLQALTPRKPPGR